MMRLSVLAIAFVGNSRPQVVAQVGIPLAPQDVMSTKYLGAGQREFSPDGKWLAYAVTSWHSHGMSETPDENYLRTGVPEDGLGSDIHVMNVQTRLERILTEGKGESWLPVWSPDGRFLAFLSTRDGSGQAKLWLWDVGQNELRKVSEAAVRSRNSMEWMPDSENIVLTLLPLVRPIAQLPAALDLSQRESSRPASNLSKRSTAVVYKSLAADEGNAIQSDPLDEEYKLRDLAVIRIGDGEVRVVVHNQRIGTFHLFADGSRVAYSSPEHFEKAGSQQLLHSLAIVEVATGGKNVLATGLRLDLAGNFSISPRGSMVGFRTMGEDGIFDIWVANLSTKKIQNLSNFGNVFAGKPVDQMHRWYYSTTLLWDGEGDNLYSVSDGSVWRSSASSGTTKEIARIPGRMVRQLVGRDWSRLAISDRDHSTVVIARDEERKHDGFYKIDLGTGAVRKLLEREECYTCDAGPRGHLAAISTDGGSIVYSSQDAQHPGDLWLSDIAFQKPSRLTKLNPQLDRYTMGSARLVEWLDCDGRLLRGGIILPTNYREGKRYPLLVLVYGGAVASDSTQKFGGFESGVPYLNVQLFATRGYAVLMPDAPQQMGTPMLDLAKTVLPGVNRMIELGIADPEKVGVLGHSYGGYSVLSLLVETNRFKAAMALNGMGNLVSLYGEMDNAGIAFGTSSETGQELVGGPPWQYRDRYIENSPLFYLDRVRTPVLLVHGAADRIFAAFLSDELFVALRRLGKVVEYAKYKDDHIFANEENQLDVCDRMLRWFDSYLKTPQ